MALKLLPEILMLTLFAFNSDLLAVMVFHCQLLVKTGEAVLAFVLDGSLKFICCFLYKGFVVYIPDVKREDDVTDVSAYFLESISATLFV
jgi:hypothetical protein